LPFKIFLKNLKKKKKRFVKIVNFICSQLCSKLFTALFKKPLLLKRKSYHHFPNKLSTLFLIYARRHSYQQIHTLKKKKNIFIKFSFISL